MTSETTESARKAREMCSFSNLMALYPTAPTELAGGVLHALVKVAATPEEEDLLFQLLMREAETAPVPELQALAMKFLARKMKSSLNLFNADLDYQRRKDCLALLARTNWRGRLNTREWTMIQEFVASRFKGEEDRRRYDDEVSPLYDQVMLDQALINTCNWDLIISKRLYRIIPQLYDLVLRRVAGNLSPAEYQSGRYLPESGLFRGEYHLRAFNMLKLARTLEENELARIGRDALRMVVLCGDAKLERGMQELDVGRAVTLFALIATALDELDLRQKMESILPLPAA